LFEQALCWMHRAKYAYKTIVGYFQKTLGYIGQ
jgi:hypothetical protein